LAVVVGATVVLTDPIFQGLAIALMAGRLVSMVIAPVAVPLLYFMANNRKPRQTSESR
jgi:multidrug efflux pump subunit AcrB